MVFGTLKHLRQSRGLHLEDFIYFYTQQHLHNNGFNTSPMPFLNLIRGFSNHLLPPLYGGEKINFKMSLKTQLIIRIFRNCLQQTVIPISTLVSLRIVITTTKLDSFGGLVPNIYSPFNNESWIPMCITVALYLSRTFKSLIMF